MALLAPGVQAATPYTPASDATILLQRPAGLALALRSSRLPIAPADDAARIAAVKAAIAQARRSGDPRYYGQAQALLGGDWTSAAPPAPLRLLRASLRQQRHQFADALADLDAVLASDPTNAQARLIRANIQMLQGEPAMAKADCAALLGKTSLLVASTCIGSVAGLSGQAETGLQVIELALQREPNAAVELRLWALTQAAEIAERLGDSLRAAALYTTALAEAKAAGENDIYLKAAYADFLLLQQRADEVRELLAAETESDPLLLRLALAEQQQAQNGNTAAQGRAAQYLDDLMRRYRLAAERGDANHWREQAMAALHLQQDANAALRYAQNGWAEQQEPADALLLLQAAKVAAHPTAAQPVLDWLARTRLQDVRMTPLVDALRARR